MARIKYLYVLLLYAVVLHAQIERWVFTYSGPGDGADECLSIVYGLDDSIYTAGYSYSGSGLDFGFTAISLSSSGATRWYYWDDFPYFNIANSVICGSDSNIYIAGKAYRFTQTSGDFYIVSLTSSGGYRWSYRYNGPADNLDEAKIITYGLDGNIYAAGKSTGNGTGDDFTVVSLTSSGTEKWVYRYNGPGNGEDEATAVVYGLDGNIYAAGNTTGSGTETDFTVISLNTAGQERWVYRYNGAGDSVDLVSSLSYGLDGNIYAAGRSQESGVYCFTVISLDTSGNERWLYKYNGPGNSDAVAYSLVCGLDSNIYVAGASIQSGSWDLTVIKLDTLGNEQWVYTYNGSGSSTDAAYSIVYGLDGNIYTAGRTFGGYTTYWDAIVVSLTNTGRERWVYIYNGSGNGNEYFGDGIRSLVYGLDHNIYAAGTSAGYGTGLDYLILSLTSTPGIEEHSPISELEGNFATLSSFFNRRITIKFNNASNKGLKIALCNTLGSIVYETSLNSTPSLLCLDDEAISKLPKGIYFLSISVDSEIYPAKKLIKF